MNTKRILAYVVYYVIATLVIFGLQIFAFVYFEKNWQTLLALSGMLLFVIIPIDKCINKYLCRK